MDIEIRGLRELERKFERMGRDLRPDMAKAMDRAMKYTQGEVPDYPAPPANSRYRRTHVLGNSITSEVRTVGSDIVGAIGTATVYAPWVISTDAAGGAGPQAKAHRGRWWTLQGVVEKAKDGIIEILEKAVAKLIKD
jgi:hypothetical protein